MINIRGKINRKASSGKIIDSRLLISNERLSNKYIALVFTFVI